MDYIILDIREPSEYQNGHVEGAINLPPSSLMQGAPEIKDVPKDAQIIVYCITGSRSNVAKQILSQLGYKHITNGINKAHVEARLLK